MAATRRKPRKNTPSRRRPSSGSRRRSRRVAAWKRRWRRLRRRLQPYGRAAYWSAVAVLWAGLGLAGVLGYFALDLPSTAGLWSVDRRPTLTVVDARGRVLARRGVSYGPPLGLSELPPYLPQAVIATEDRRFYYHVGIDPVGIVRAAWANATHGKVVQGGSTITQQLAKNLFLTNQRTFKRKIQEVMLAFWLEWRFSKDQILTLYLNRVYLGAGTYGVEAAAQRYFGKSATEVSLAEAALLAGLLKAPSRYAPTRDVARARSRTRIVLDRMVEAGFITPADRQRAFAAPAEVVRRAASDGIEYFIDWVVQRVPDSVAGRDVDLVIETTLDLTAQRYAERALALLLDRDGRTLNIGQGALVSLTPGGAVVAMVGGRSYFASQFNRAVQARRQPGSAFKPFVYLAALEAGWQPDSPIMDAPIRIGDWAPRNFSDRYQGQVTLTTALARSFNTAAVRLTEQIGRQSVIDVARRLGLRSELRPTRSLPLGTYEVSVLELTAAYAAFANGGFRVAPYAIRRIRTPDGALLYERPPSAPPRVVAARHVGALNAMLAEAVRRGTGRRAFLGPRPVAGKTGTSQDSRDAWFVGYTADLVTGVWLGNDDFSPMKRVTGGTAPAVVWKDYMLAVTTGQPVHALPGASDRAVIARQTPARGNALTRFLSRWLPGE